MKKKSSVITPPPNMEAEQGSEGNLALSDDQRKDALLKLIRKGAPSVPREEVSADISTRARFSLRIKRDLLERVEQAAKGRAVETPVNTWLIEAIIDKLKKEGF